MRRTILARLVVAATIVAAALLVTIPADAYPPGVGILAKNRSCNSCHVSNGPWQDDERTIIDLLDADKKTSLRGADGVFRVEVPRGQSRTVITVIGRKQGEATPPYRNAWLYVDTSQIATSSLSKFAPGWDVNLPMACRIVGDKSETHASDHVTVLPMTIRPTDAARDGELELQVMLTSGESVKGNAKEGLVSNYFVRKVALKVIEP